MDDNLAKAVFVIAVFAFAWRVIDALIAYKAVHP